ncbi:MAG: hypothetical protein LBK61_09410 [Spirochaetaceae bacterium]|nr:hypothetical protein [Spirochaetaceae bacterium]
MRGRHDMNGRRHPLRGNERFWGIFFAGIPVVNPPDVAEWNTGDMKCITGVERS